MSTIYIEISFPALLAGSVGLDLNAFIDPIMQAKDRGVSQGL